MTKGMLRCLAALVLLSSAVAAPAAFAGGVGNEQGHKEKLVAHLKKAQAEQRRVEVSLRNGAHLLGKVGEVRERGFTLEPDDRAEADALKAKSMVAAVLYEEVSSVQYPSKTRKFFKGLGLGFRFAGEFAAFLPVYGVLALLGELPSC
ncbi:MAG: hypothetical protein JOZ96_06440 [Acidobacteria bacterium]|nr:hypothetical protein [Acidobacteriota bacterium]